MNTLSYNIWLEAAMLPFQLMLALFLTFRFSTSARVNVRFRIMTWSTFLTTCFAVISTLLINHERSPWLACLLIRTLYYALTILNAYHLMRYFAAYVRMENRVWHLFNLAVLYAGFAMLVLNLKFGFFFTLDADDNLVRGSMHSICRSVFVLYFMVISIVMLHIKKELYARGQFLIVNALMGILLLAFVVQYIFLKDLYVAYTVATILMFIIFFYLEAPMYREMRSMHLELEDAMQTTRDATKRAEAANRAKSNFLANTSHEIRTPVNAILGMNEMIEKEALDEETKDAAAKAHEAGEQLLAIINNILDISKIESGKMELFETEYHLRDIICPLTTYGETMAQVKGIDFSVRIDPKTPEHLYGDGDHLTQIMENLIENAVKYTDEGEVALSVLCENITEEDTDIQFMVEDEGQGIKKSDMKTLFDPFARANIKNNRHIRGAGLGLVLVKYLVELMGGRIRVESLFGVGSAFTFTLTQKKADGEETLSYAAYEEELQAHPERMMAERVFTEDEIAAFRAEHMKVLLVDDTAENLIVAKGMLSSTGLQPDTATSGEEALEMMTKEPYDIVFLDHQMPGMDGVECMQIAKSLTNNASKDAHFIALTANTGTGAKETYVGYGFDDYIGKPFKREEMIVALMRFGGASPE